MARASAASLALFLVSLSGCFAEHGDERGCDNHATYRGERLQGLVPDVTTDSAIPPRDGTLSLRASICDKEGTYVFERLKGVPPQSGLLRDGLLFVGRGFLFASPLHPLNRAFAESIDADSRPVRGCRDRRINGRVLKAPLVTPYLFVRRPDGRQVDVTMHPAMTTDLPRVGGLPRLAAGTRVRLRGKACRSGRFYAMSIALAR